MNNRINCYCIKFTVLLKKVEKNKNFNTDDITRRINILKKLRQFCFSRNFQCYSNNMKNTLKSCVRYSYVILIEQINTMLIVINCRMIFIFLKTNQFKRSILMNLICQCFRHS